MNSKDQNNNKLAQWRSTLEQLRDSTGISFKEIAEYAGLTYNEDGAAFYLKLPRKRSAYIGIMRTLKARPQASTISRDTKSISRQHTLFSPRCGMR